MTALEMIRAALRVIGVLDPGETLDGATALDCLQTLNSVLKTWASEEFIQPNTTTVEHTLAVGEAVYTIDSSSTASTTHFNASRPRRVDQAIVRLSGVDYEVELKDKEFYNRKTIKTVQGRPDIMVFQPGKFTAKLFFYPTPDAAYTLLLEQLTIFDNLSDLSSEIELGGEFEEPLKYQLALRLAPEFKVNVSAVVVRDADYLLNRLRDNSSAETPNMIFEDVNGNFKGYVDIRITS